MVGSEKTRNRKSTRKKVKKKQWFLDFNLPLCFRPNPETGVAPFHNRSNPCFRVWPEMHWNPLIQILREISAFLPVSLTSVTLVKNGQWVFSGSRHPESFRPNPQTRVAPINAQRNPCLRVWSETHSIPLIEISFLKKASFSLQNSALIAILIVKGREVVF